MSYFIFTCVLFRFHLVILNNILHSQNDEIDSLKKSLELVDEGGFLLVKETTQNAALHLALEGCNGNSSALENGRNNLSDEAWIKMFKDAGLELVMHTTASLMSSMFLLRKTFTQVIVIWLWFCLLIRVLSSSISPLIRQPPPFPNYPYSFLLT